MRRNTSSRLELKKQMHLLPGHIVVSLWCLFTIGMLAWIAAASLSTSPEIMRGKALQFETGLHFENYVKAWTANNISVFFMNSLLYASTAMVGSLLVSAPAAYVLARFVFKGNSTIRSGFVMAMSLPQIMIVLPLFFLTTKMGLTGSKFVLILIYIGIACFSLSLIFQLVTLPVEFNASRRAMNAIDSMNILTDEEQQGARKTLRAAAMTYVMATLAAFTQLLRLVLLFGRRRRN